MPSDMSFRGAGETLKGIRSAGGYPKIRSPSSRSAAEQATAAQLISQRHRRLLVVFAGLLRAAIVLLLAGPLTDMSVLWPIDCWA